MTVIDHTAIVTSAWRQSREAADAATAARARLALALAAAQDDGLSVRQLADALDVQPTTVQRLISAARSES